MKKTCIIEPDVIELKVMTPKEIRELRLKMGLTQAQFAYKIGVQVGTVARWEAGNFTPTPLAQRQLDKLAKK